MKFMVLAAILLLFGFCCPVFAGTHKVPADSNVVPSELTGKSEVDYFPRKIVTGPKAWAVACCALLVEYNHGWHDTLAFEPQKPSLVQNLKVGLKEGWGIEDKDGLTKNLYWLETQGHRAYFQKLGRQIQNLSPDEFAQMLRETTDQERLYELRIVHDQYKKLGKKSLAGWDFERAIYLCRAGYECGYFSEEEAWYRIMMYARLLQQTFDSWEDLGQNYLIGRQFWSQKHTLDSGDDLNDAFMILTEMPSSPWNTLDWNMDLLNGEADNDE